MSTVTPTTIETMEALNAKVDHIQPALTAMGLDA